MFSTTAGSKGNNPLPPPPPRSRSGRPPRHPSSSTNEVAPRRRERDQHHIPISNVIRVMRQILPASAKITDDAKETIQECISKFIAHISEEANKIRTEELRKVVTADDIVAAMSKKGFEYYADVLSTYLYRYREAEGKDDFTRVLRMRLSRPIVVGPDAGKVPPPVMADPYFYPHHGVSIGGGGGGHGQYVNQGYAPGTGGGHDGYGMAVIGGGDEFVNHVYGNTIDSTMMNFDAGSSSYGSTVNSTMMNFDAGSSSYGSTVNGTMMNFHVGSSCNNIGGGCNEYDGHWYGETGIGGGHSEYAGQGYDSTINPMMNPNFVGSYNNNDFGGGRGIYDDHRYGVSNIGGNADHGYGMVDISGGHGESVNQRYGDGVAGIGGASGQYADRGYGVDIGGGGGVGEIVDQGYASTINNTMMNDFSVLESSSYNYIDNNVLLEYNDVFDGLLAPNSTQNVESIDVLQVMK
uniref:Transcription factor CBF/NF-Y/archaeal histone domain-containing protein n=1 Tax=Chenopodium quinoa TaxID=63459 RepID=A0A803NDD7_CHEQI